MLEGTPFSVIKSETGIDSWPALAEAAYLQETPETWVALQSAWAKAREIRLADLAQDVAEHGRPAIKRHSTGPDGVSTSEERRTDAAMIDKALAAISPGTHGRFAGREADRVTAPIVVQIRLGEGLCPPGMTPLEVEAE